MTATDGLVTVLAVDDDDRADTYALWLSDDYCARTAYGGAEALERVGDAVDIVPLDRPMPEVPGDEVLAAVHDRPGNYRVAILTAVEDAEVVELPFDVYLTKPVTRADPVATVSRLVTRQSLEAGLGRQERLLATCDALSARPEGALTEALCAVEEDIAANHESVCGDPEDLDDRYVAWSLVERE